jgi:hypothetical protein
MPTDYHLLEGYVHIEAVSTEAQRARYRRKRLYAN